MRVKNIRHSIGVFLYDRQLGGKKLDTAKKSFQEVFKTLQGERSRK